MLWIFLACNAPCDDLTPCRILGGKYYTIEPSHTRHSTPAVIMMHGWNGTPTGYAKKSEIQQLAAAGIRVLLPEGKNKTWNVTEAPLERDDVSFLLDVIEDAQDRFDLDEDNIFASGFSMGASMASLLGCQHPEVFSAIAPTSGGFFMPLPQACEAAISVRHEHGLSDKMWPIEGRTLWEDFEQSPIQDNLDLWAQVNQCEDGIDLVELDDERSCRTRVGCANNTEIVMCTHERGHVRLSDWGTTTADWLMSQ